MKLNIAILTLATGLTMSAAQQSQLTFSRPATTEGIVSRTAAVKPSAGRQADAFAVNRTKPAKTAVARVVATADEEITSPYGTPVVIFEEHFDKMTQGSEDNPALDENINYAYGEYEYPWWNMKPGYTEEEHWGSNYAYPAGGCVYLNAGQEGASLNTPLIDASQHNAGMVTLRFRARTTADVIVTTGLYVESAETFNMSPTWDILGGVRMPEVTATWQTFEVTFYGAGSSTLFNIVQTTSNPVYIDDIVVYQIDQYVDTPVALTHTNYTGESFDANWEAVSDAESYLLNVYQTDSFGENTYLLEDQPANGTSYTVTGIESGAIYYYTVRSVKGENISMETQPVEVFDLEAPVLNYVSDMTAEKYTATWSEVPTAERYNYWAYNERTAWNDGEFVVTDENFDGITDADGNLTGLTLDMDETSCYDETYLNLSQAGWRGLNYYPYTDYIMVDGWQYMYNRTDAGLVSPELDLSKDGGKINLSVRLYAEIAEIWLIDSPQPEMVQTEAAIALFNYDETAGDYVQAELIYPEGVAQEWKTFNVTLTKGSERSVIGIYAVKSAGRMFIDDLKITQNYKAGETLREPFFFQRWNEGTSVEVSIPERIGGQAIYHKVSAIKSRSLDGYSVERKESKFSALEQIRESAGVTDISLDETAEAAESEYYNLQGVRVTDPANGLYIEVRGNQARKILVQ